MTGRIFNIQTISFHDGPGIRTTVFFKGCNLKCAWCHNPESQSFEKELLFYKDKCTGCGRCNDKGLNDAFICFNKARELCGRDVSVEELFSEIKKDKAFFEASGGGVTFSGGECMLQIDFLEEILKVCKEKGIHTAVDTAGHVPNNFFDRIIPYTDLFLYDIKAMNSELHKQYTGVENCLILENLAKLLKAGKRVWVRIPVIPGVNDTVEEMQAIKAFFKENAFPEKTELLPYHTIGKSKYEALNKPFIEFDAVSKDTITKLEEILSF